MNDHINVVIVRNISNVPVRVQRTCVFTSMVKSSNVIIASTQQQRHKIYVHIQHQNILLHNMLMLMLRLLI